MQGRMVANLKFLSRCQRAKSGGAGCTMQGCNPLFSDPLTIFNHL